MSMNFLRGAASGKPVAPPPFELSTVERAHGWWGYLWPFQTRKTLIWTLGLLAGGLLLDTAMVLLWLDPGALPYVLGGAFLGGMSAAYRVLPVKMTVTSRGDARQQVETITQLMLSRGYVVDQPTDQAGRVQYCPKSRDRWPWLYWSEQDMGLRWRDHQIELHGPFNTMAWLHGQLLEQLEA
jgi:hypothetical protein